MCMFPALCSQNGSHHLAGVAMSMCSRAQDGSPHTPAHALGLVCVSCAAQFPCFPWPVLLPVSAAPSAAHNFPLCLPCGGFPSVPTALRCPFSSIAGPVHGICVHWDAFPHRKYVPAAACPFCMAAVWHMQGDRCSVQKRNMWVSLKTQSCGAMPEDQRHGITASSGNMA